MAVWLLVKPLKYSGKGFGGQVPLEVAELRQSKNVLLIFPNKALSKNDVFATSNGASYFVKVKVDNI